MVGVWRIQDAKARNMTRIAYPRLRPWRGCRPRAVNRELVALYWDIGQAIREQQTSQGWGDAVVDRLARDLKASFRGTMGFSAASLWRMRQFHERYAAPEFLARGLCEKERVARSAPGAPRRRRPSTIANSHRQLIKPASYLSDARALRATNAASPLSQIAAIGN
jgi:hypothetical protein